MTRSAEAIAERLIPKVLEENNGKRVGAKWRNPYPLGRVKKDTVSKTSEVNAPLLEMITQFEPPLNGLVPLWQDSLTPGLEQLNTARVIYQSVQVSLGVEHRTDYPLPIQFDLEAIRDDFRDIRGSNRAGIGEGEAFKRWVTHEKLEEARMQLYPAIEPYERILAHTKQWVRFILATYKVEFTPEVEAFVVDAAKAAAITLKSGEESLFIRNVKDRIVCQMQKPKPPKVTFVDLKPGTLQKLVYPYVVVGISTYRISQELGISLAQAQGAKKALIRLKGAIPKPTPEGKLTDQIRWTKERFADPSFATRFENVIQEQRNTRIENGGYFSLDAKIKMSLRKGGVLNRTALLAPYLSPYVIADIFGKRIKRIRHHMFTTDIIHQSSLSKEEKREIMRQSSYEGSIDDRIRYLDFENALCLARTAAGSILAQTYPMKQVDPEKRDLFIAKVTHKALQSYDQNSNHGFHAHVALLVSRLPKSFIFGKIEL